MAGLISPDSLLIERLRDGEKESFDSLYDIYSQTIADSEQKPRSAMQAMLHDKNYRLFVASLGGRIVGFSIFYVSDDRAFALLEYIGVLEHVQGNGIGSKLFERSVAALNQSDGPSPILMEIDSDRETTLEHDIRLRRIRFYSKLGCRRIHGLAYTMPTLGRGTPPQMDIYVSQAGERALSKRQLQHWISTIYREIYKYPADDPRIDIMLGPLDEIVPLEPLIYDLPPR